MRVRAGMQGRGRRGALLVVLVATMSSGLVSVVPGTKAIATDPPGAWTAASSLGAGRGKGTSTLLDGPLCRTATPAAWCGKVLAAGGQQSGKGSLSSSELYDPGTGRWSPTGQMRAGRYGHTATLLDGSQCQVPATEAPPYCGKVLVAGGAGGLAGRTVLDSAELYDPATDEWSATGRMAPLGEAGAVGQPRFAHAASALDGPPCRGTDLAPLPAPDWCGRVLVVGGLGALVDTSKVETFVSVALRSAFLYDPETGTWALTGAPAVGRYEHTLTAIDDGPCRGGSLPPLYCGRLLLAGGTPTANVAAGIAPAELYDPGLGQWVPTGAMITPRYSHSAVVLAGANCPARPQCNKVLVTGGSLQATVVNHPQGAAAELYDPVTGTWASTGNALYDQDTGAELPTRGMGAGRGASHTLTLLDGRACRTTSPPGYCGKVLVVGDETNLRATSWLPGLLGPPPKLGPGSSIPSLPPPELYDPVSGSFSPTRARRTQVAGNAVLFDGPSCRGTIPAPACGQVLHFDAMTGAREAELFDAAATSQPPTVASLEPPSGPSQGGTTVTLRGAGLTGATEVRFGAAAAPEFSVVNDNTVVATSPAMAAGGVDVTVSVGSRTSAAISTTRFAVFPSNLEWTATGSLVSARPSPTVTALRDGRALLVGGDVGPSNSAGVDSVDLFDPSTGQWYPVPPLSTPRSSHTATLLPSGEVLVAGGSGPLASAEVFDPATGLWRRTGTMTSARALHTATLLPSGKVLVTGGVKDAANLVQPSAEVYDPDAVDPTTGERGTWAQVAPMRSYRHSHHAALLADGRVLVVGGSGCDSAPAPVVDKGDWEPSCGEQSPPAPPDSEIDRVFDPSGNRTFLQSAEVYDPAAGPVGAWSVTGGLSAVRASHTTTSLATGGVLVAGGCTNGKCGSPETAELYDPQATDPATGAKGAWRTVHGMAAPRDNHTATVLAGPTCAELCGHVLVAGGNGRSSAELYDPSSGAWRPAPPLAGARGSHRAALLTDGQVLVVGGEGATLPSLTGSAELFRVDAGQPLIAAVEPPAGPPGTRVVIRGTDLFETTSVNFGGVSVDPVAVTEAVVVAVSPPQRRGPVPVSVTTPLGKSINSPVSDGDDYTYAAGRWRGGPDMATARFLHTASLLDGPECRRAASPAYCGRVLVAGGTADFAADEHLVPYDSAEVYDPDAGTWSPTGSMRSPRFDHTATLLDGPACRGDAPAPFCGKVLVAGGRVGASAIVGAELYDPASGTWTGTASMKAARLSHTATLLADGRVLVVGGAPDEPNRGGLASAEIYDPTRGTWQETADPHGRRNSHTATLLADGKVLVAGGLDNLADGDDLVRTTEVYDPVARTWNLVEPMAVPRFAHSAVLVSGPRCGGACGKVLVVGGVKTLDDESTTFHESAELFDPVSRTWTPAFAPRRARAGHSAHVLANGQVLVAGSSVTFPQLPLPTPVASAELWDPLTGRWTPTHELATRRGIAGGAVLNGPACRRPAPPAYCGAVLVAGGGTAGLAPGSIVSPPALRSSEIYSSAPDVHRLTPPGGTADGGTTVELSGAHLAGTSSVHFGGRQAASFVVHSPTSLTAVSPPADDFEPVEVTVEGPGGSSGRLGGNPAASYSYLGTPGPVTALVARAVSSDAIELTFGAAHVGDGSTPAQAYVVKQSGAEITEANFDAPTASVLCGGICRFDRPALNYTLRVGDLEPGRTYHYALRAVNDKGRGPLSISVSATTERLVAEVPSAACAQPTAADAGTVVYPGGRYSLLGLPDGVVVRAQSPLYGWSDLGAGGSYTLLEAARPVTGGRGYWAWFSCPTAVTLPRDDGGGPTTFPLGAYHASMVGNPTLGQATVSGQDFAATWDAQAGAYRMSGYRQPETLAVGEGAWTFSYVQTEVRIAPSG